MDETTARVLSDLARMHENRAKGADPAQADYFLGGAAALRMAMLFLAPPVANHQRPESPAPEVEEEEFPYPCPECELSYALPQGLGIHRRHAHGVVGASRSR